MTTDDVEVIEKTTPFQGYFRIDRYRLRHRQHAGGMGAEQTREIFERGHAVTLVPYDPVADRVVLIEQFRPGAFAARQSGWFADDFSPWLIETVAGIIDPGESPADVAIREAVEEAGCEVTDLVQALHYLATPGGSTESMFVYIGRIDSSGVGGVHGLADEGEDIRVFTVPTAEAFAMVDDGRIINAMTLIAINWLRSHLDEVHRQWGIAPSG